ncbi:hypothetical protein BGW36DRAFT_361802 [Talaromyces proteolyticus]|uniref:Uncharacterized protein n=1 Tax=Talaromyces proteolyticus TaxID=1131652 RepID=A0AAD4KMX0_9EURO|nr:uncharacterized protein BGW36DRAFT_361802 [Talaromyces proteolyticus]KAH8693980.1 hypothetical protein BGW36DRAFT_361802 [Talaromyces proteolyticus]
MKRKMVYGSVVILALCLLKFQFRFLDKNSGSNFTTQVSYSNHEIVETIVLPGFCNNGIPGKISCDSLRHNDSIGVEQSFHLDDDMVQIAMSMWSHPLIGDHYGELVIPFDQLVKMTWSRFHGSGVWLPDYGVYLVVSRVIYSPLDGAQIVSFLRGQIYDEEWNSLENYTIHGNCNDTTFPRIFEIPAAWDTKGGPVGPEDPRVILEEVPNAEPVIIFNMPLLDNPQRRAMWIHRPFSNFTTPLTIRNGQPARIEKNWAPFFFPEADNSLSSSSSSRPPSQYLHFVYSLRPLYILKCHLLDGYCDWIFKQEVTPNQFILPHQRVPVAMHGGTNFVSVPLANAFIQPGVNIYVGFPRTHLDGACSQGATYRPELMVMTSMGASYFHLAYASEAIDFSNAVLDPEALDIPCADGRILIPNSIIRWDQRHDKITLSVSVADKTVQIVYLHGILRLTNSLPLFPEFLKQDFSQGGEALWNFRWSIVGNDVLACSIEAVANASYRNAIEN